MILVVPSDKDQPLPPGQAQLLSCLQDHGSFNSELNLAQILTGQEDQGTKMARDAKASRPFVAEWL